MIRAIKISAIIIITIFFFGCKNEKERESAKLKDDLRTYFELNLMDSTEKLDSFRLREVDTITERMLLLEQSSVLGRQLDNLIDLYKLSNQNLSNSVDQMRLYRILQSQDLVTVEKNNFDKERAKGQLIKTEIDTLTSIIDSIDLKLNHADTIKPIGYQAKCFFQLRRKDKSVEQDSTFIILNINKDIVKRQDFLNLPYNVDFDKLK